MLRVARFILRHHVVVLAATVLVIGVGAWQRLRLTESQSLQALIVKSDERRVVFERMQRDFGDDEVLAVAVDVDVEPPLHASIYESDVLDTIDDLTRWLDNLDTAAIKQVTSLTSLQYLQMPMGLRPLYTRGGGVDQSRLIEAYVRSHPLYAQRLVSADGKTALVLVRFQERDSERINHLTRAIEAGLPRYEGRGVRMWLAGYPVIRSKLIDASKNDTSRLLYVALLVIVVILVGAFRHPTPVILAVVVIAAGVVVSMGAIAALGIRMNNLLSMVPALVLIIASSTSMHLLTRYRAERQRGADRQSATARALVHVGPGCFWASATTAIGFLGLMVSQVPALRQCGYCSAMGVGFSFVLAVVLIPTVLTLWRRGAPAWEPTADDVQAAVHPSLLTESIGRFVTRFAKPILVLAVLLSGAAIYGITCLNVETNRLEYFRQSDPLRLAYERVESQFGGLTEIDVLIRGPDDHWLDPTDVTRLDSVDQSVRALERLERALVALEGIDGSLSLVALLSHVNQELTGIPTLPADRAGMGQVLQLTTRYAGDRTAAFLTEDGRTVRIVLFSRRKSSRNLEALIAQVDDVLAKHTPEGWEAERTGSAVVFAGMVRYVVAGQIYGLMIVMGVLFAIMVLLTRRIVAGFVCLLPTVVPILTLYGVMAALGIPLNLHTSIVSALAAGIAIDNAIHMLSAFRREYARTGDYAGSVRRAIHIIGRALVVNALLLACGLGAFSQGTLLPIMQLGLLLAMTMVNAAIMGLFLLPALMLVLRPRIGRP